MSIAFFIISNVILFFQFFMFLSVNFLFWLDSKINHIKDSNKANFLFKKNLVDYEGKILIIKSKI